MQAELPSWPTMESGHRSRLHRSGPRDLSSEAWWQGEDGRSDRMTELRSEDSRSTRSKPFGIFRLQSWASAALAVQWRMARCR